LVSKASGRRGAGSERGDEQVGKVVVFMNLTLDGVMQAPGWPGEDRHEEA
jgi:hypothetical protein